MRKVLQRLLGVLILIPLICAISVASAAETTLTFTVPKGVTTFQLYSATKNFDPAKGTLIEPTDSKTENGTTYYYYEGYGEGYYYYKASGEGYYKVKKNVYISADEVEQGELTIDANPGRMAGGGFEPDVATDDNNIAEIKDHTDELNAAQNALTEEQRNQYDIFDTPYFTRGKSGWYMETEDGKHQQTTQAEMMAFLADVVGSNDNVYQYSLGTSPKYGHDVPILIFTKADLSGARTLEEAAERIKEDNEENDKLTIHYSALVHGNEGACGEAALAMIEELAKGYYDEQLDTVNIYVIPRVSPDGAQDYTRNNGQNIDMNRDYMAVQSPEIELIHYARQLFMAEVAVDGHEFQIHDYNGNTKGEQTLTDLMVGQSGSQNMESNINALVNELEEVVFDAEEAEGLRPFFYWPYTTAQYTRGRGHYSLNGAVGILFETRGYNYGLNNLERRMYSMHVAVDSAFKWAADNVARIKEEVAEARASIISKGAVYDEDNLLVLKHKQEPLTKERVSNWYDMATGEYLYNTTKATDRYVLVPEVTRARPTAYVIPANNGWAEDALETIQKHGIEYETLPAGAAVMLQQYEGDHNGAALREETLVTFLDGAYVLPMDQVGGTVLALLMEPDVMDVNVDGGDWPCTLVQSKTINPAADGTLPIYRYVRDLETEGSEYKVAVTMNVSETPEDHTAVNGQSIEAAGEITVSGYYFLARDIIDGPIVIKADDVTLCLHGQSITTTGQEAAVRVEGENVTLCNCTSKGGMVSNDDLRCVYVAAGSLTMGEYVHIDGADITAADDDAPVSAVQVADGASFTMEGGTIRNNTLTNTGSGGAGVIVALGTAKVDLTGGRICGNAVTGSTGIASVVKLGSGTLTIGEGVLIESNTMESSTNGAAIYVDTSGATVTMTGGSISGNKGTFGRGVMISKGSFTMSGGTISSNSTTSKPGAGVLINGGTFILSGTGTISRNNANGGAGAGVDLTSGTFIMSGGSITKNTTSSSYGGGLCARNGTATITSGTIAGNLLTNTGRVYGLDVSCGINGYTGATLTISGGTIGADTTSCNLTVCSGTTILKGTAVVNGTVGVVGTYGKTATLKLQDDARINGDVVNSLDPPDTKNKGTTTVEISGGSVVGKISVDITDGVRENDVTTISGGKFSQQPDSSFLAGSRLEFVALEEPEGDLKYTVAAKAGGACPDSHRGTKLSGTETALGTAGTNTFYYLDGNTTFAPSATIKVSGNVTLCLNDCVLTVTSAAITNFLQVNADASLTICGGGYGSGKIVGPGALTTTNNVRCLNVYGTLILDSGTITGFRVTGAGSAVAVHNAYGKFTMNGGKISGNYATGDGAVYINNSSATDGTDFTMNGGIIGGAELGTTTKLNENTGNYSAGSNGGGGVGAAGTNGSVIVELKGGSISYNQTAKQGGGVWGGGQATIKLSGTTITGNKAVNGGGVRVGKTLEMSAGTISNNTATEAGGGVYLNTGSSVSATFTLSGTGEISKNTCATKGGGVYVTSGAQFTMNGGAIKENIHTGSSAGGAGVLTEGTFTMKAGTISGNLSNTASGGGVYMWTGTFTMSGGTISGNTANVYAGGVMARQGTFALSGDGKISGNKLKASSHFGTQVCVGANNTSSSSTTTTFFNMTGGTIDATGVSSLDLSVLLGTAAIKDGTVIGNVDVIGALGGAAALTIEGGAVNGEVTSGTGPLTSGSTTHGACDTTITGGKFSDDTARDTLVDFLPAESALTVAEVEDGAYAYKVGEGFHSGDGEHMEFGSSLALGLYLVQDNSSVALSDCGFQVSGGYGHKLGTAADRDVFYATGIAAKDMDKEITFTITKKSDGTVLFRKTASIYNAATKWHGDEDKATMMADMIAYGNAAKTEFAEEGETPDLMTGLSGATTGEHDWSEIVSSKSSTWSGGNVGVSLNLKERIELNFYLQGDGVSKATIEDLLDAGEDPVTVTDVEGVANTVRVTFGSINVKDVKTPVTLKIGENESITYSIADYVVANTKQKDLMDALAKYVDSVCDYMALKNGTAAE